MVAIAIAEYRPLLGLITHTPSWYTEVSSESQRKNALPFSIPPLQSEAEEKIWFEAERGSSDR